MALIAKTEITTEQFLKNNKIIIVGSLSHFRDVILEDLKKNMLGNFVYSKRNNSDIFKYLDSIEYIDKKNSYTLSAIEYTLEENNFENVLKISNKGEWSKKGDLITFWPIEYDHPIRVSYFGDDIEYIEMYDEIYGSKIRTISQFILGNLKKLPDKVDRYEIELSGYEDIKKNKFVVFSQYDPKLQKDNHHENFDFTIIYDLEYPTLYYKRFDLLEKEIAKLEKNNWTIIVSSRHKEELSKNLSNKVLDDNTYKGIELDKLSAGISSKVNKLLILTDRELFGTIFLQNERKKVSLKEARKILDQLEGEIEIGDFVVHEDHGIGIYKGLQQEKRIEEQIVNFEHVRKEIIDDYLQVSYAEGDELLIPISQIQKITKYIGTTNDSPLITRLHKGLWQTAVRKAKKAVEIIAKDLVEHYAKVQVANTDSIDLSDSQEYKNFVAAFPYEETPDQINVIEDIKKDLALPKPMDRLIVGDVGFGKTEVSMRAAFKVVEQGKQVAVLCPTTVLAAQHYKVFKDRFESYEESLGINVAYVSRFNTPSENKKTIEDARTGKIEILVGTHRLLSNDVEFEDLGLIIIDEEQKFGVKQKEKIKKLQYSAHSLTMTATPIPRTLSMAMSQIKDISIISTPPVGRRSVETHVEKIDWNKIAIEIETELKRGGQVYFVHNRVETIESIKLKLKNLLPDVRFAVGHGKMTGKALDEVITGFYAKKYDVLICTTIIENGIDMPNVNTIIINDGQNFGLGQLYQLRGRVGRSDKQAFCYIYYKGDTLVYSGQLTVNSGKPKVLDGNEEIVKNRKPKKYMERLKAILESQDLGSGFKLASRDLEIRGAGNLLGKQQHGNIHNVGLALYMQMLAEEIERIKSLGVKMG